jgi:hypothetical protein
MASPIDSAEEFVRDETGQLTPEGQAQRWTAEFQAARGRLKKWHKQGEDILDRFLDERTRENSGESRLNLFTANVETQHSMLYGQTPKCAVSRRFGDSKDDLGRVAGEMLERLLNTDIERDGSSYASAIAYALEDRLLPGLGFCCARYEMEEGTAQDPETGEDLTDESGAAIPAKSYECVETDWHYWKAVLWSPCRTHELSRWYAWCAPLTNDEGKQRFGGAWAGVPMNTKTGKKGAADAVQADPWARADVWEIWCKEDRTVYWFVEGMVRMLDQKPDPLGLEDFYPFPKPMMARPTTRNYVPRPDFVIAQDLYNEIDTLSTRINLLEKAIRIAGAYDKNSPEVARLLTDAGFNKLYPSENWNALAEKGGFKGVVDWFPLEQVVQAIAVLSEKRAEKIGLLQQTTGWADIMRGQSNPNETLGAQKLKARFGGVRVERFQREFSDFATGLLKIKAEIIAKHFDVETIVERSNMMFSADAEDQKGPDGQPIPGSGKELIAQAAQLIKDKLAQYRIEVKPEAISLTDFAQMKEERVEVVGALAQLFTAAQPVLQSVGPQAAGFFLELGKWVIAGTKGSSEMEGVFDRFADQAEQAAMAPPPPPQPDPKLEATKVKSQAEIQKTGMDMQATQLEHAGRMQQIQAEMAQDAEKTKNEIVRAQMGPAFPMEGE